MASLLTIPKSINFGLEIECNNVFYDEVKRLVNNKCDWYIYVDRSCGEKSAEIVSPVLNNTKETIKLLNKISSTIKHLSPTFEGCSFQINYDLDLFKDDEELVYFLKLFSSYESVIYGYSRGYDEALSTDIEVYRRPITPRLNDYLRLGNEAVIDSFTNNKHEAISFKKDASKYNKDLIEFRTINGTDDISLWLNYINFFYYLIKFAKRKNYELIEEEYQKNKYRNVESTYKIINDEKATKLSNMIFKNEEEKTLFLNLYKQKR